MTRSSRYRYVDFAAQRQAGFRNHVVAVDEVAGLVQQCGALECYATIFCFADDIFLYMQEHRVDGRPSVAGYDGRVWAAFLPLDIDAHPPVVTLEDALALARRTYSLLTERWHVPAAALHPYFSGAKGFHLLIDTRVFGRLTPAHDLHRVFSHLRLQILRQLPERARPLFDLAIGDKVRLLRLPNTRHGGSGLYKVALTAEELLHASVADVSALARTPRPLLRVTDAGLSPTEVVEAVPTMLQAFRRARRALQRQRGTHPYRLHAAPSGAAEDTLCAARRAMWTAQVEPGNRNNVAIRLASAFRLGGYDERQALDLLREWDHRQHTPLPDSEIRNIAHSAYARPYPYAYGCHDEVIRTVCPYVGRLQECADYRERHPRSERGATHHAGE